MLLTTVLAGRHRLTLVHSTSPQRCSGSTSGQIEAHVRAIGRPFLSYRGSTFARMSIDNHDLIAGELFTALAESLRDVKFGSEVDGMVHVRGSVGPPVRRAVMRLEAELLIKDADAMQAGAPVDRTDRQRRADAFLELGKQVAARLPVR